MHTGCGALRISDNGKAVNLRGWVHRRRDHGALIFIDLRDWTGITQLVFDQSIDAAAHKLAEQLRSEFVIKIDGKVRPRGEDAKNPKMPTGDIEVEGLKLEILNRAETPVFPVADEHQEAQDQVTWRQAEEQ